jgi:hypothetical protein
MGARHFGIGEESAWGNATAATTFLEALSETVQKELTTESVETLRSFSPIDLVPLSTLVRGDVEVLANYNGMLPVFKHLLGSGESGNSTVYGNFYNHTFPDSQGLPATDRIGLGLSLEFRRDGALAWQYPGGKISAMSHTFGTDQSSRMTLTFLAKEDGTAPGDFAISTASWSTLRPIYPSHVNIKFDGTNLLCRSVTINVENPLDETFLLGSTGLATEPDRSGVMRVTGTAEVLVNETDTYGSFDGATNIDCQVIGVALNAGDNGTYEWVYNMDKVKLTQATPHNTGRDRLAATYEFEAIYNSNETENFQVGIINLDSAI